MSQPEPIIADRGEFIDALTHLRRGCVLVRSDNGDERCVLNGSLMYTVFEPLVAYGLIDEVPNRDRLDHMHCYRLNSRGQAFADRACQAWKQRPLLQRLAVRLTG
ncbi:MAG: hypothetical protein Q8R98_25280 [Rubrivivax sp.]|nr:hypothetical protein [Rubrivivax sp.]MDP3221532.1 hypothetical protein [Rubrivivax sp.]MDP3615170.1 hypothetical protein [Rubrivivax sp.]